MRDTRRGLRGGSIGLSQPPPEHRHQGGIIGGDGCRGSGPDTTFRQLLKGRGTNMPSLGLPEIAIILVIVLIFFGVGKLPQVGGALGEGIREFRKASEGEFEGEENETPADAEAAKAANGS